MSVKESLYPFVFKVLNNTSKIIPLRNYIVFESNPDFADNTYFIYKKMLERGLNKKYKFVWLVKDSSKFTGLPENVFAVNRETGSFIDELKNKRIIMHAKFIIDCNNYVHKINSKTVRVHLKHGLPMKEIDEYNHMIGETDLLCVPSQYWVKKCSQEHLVSEDVVKPLGFPRNEVLIPKKHNYKNIIWMPTYRIHQKDVQGFSSEYKNKIAKEMPFGLPYIDNAEKFKKLNGLFNEYNSTLYLRLHPSQDVSALNSLDNMSNIKICDNKFLSDNNTTLYEFLCITDALISDYSSVYYDYLNLDKPIMLLTGDFNEYKKNNGMLVNDYDEFLQAFPALYALDFDDVLIYLRDILNDVDSSAQERKKAIEKYMGKNITDSSDRIIDYMTEHFGL